MNLLAGRYKASVCGFVRKCFSENPYVSPLLNDTGWISTYKCLIV